LDLRLQGRVDASDVLQEALLEATRQAPEYLRDPKYPLFPWLRLLVGERLNKLHRQHLGTQTRDVGPAPRWARCTGRSPSARPDRWHPRPGARRPPCRAAPRTVRGGSSPPSPWHAPRPAPAMRAAVPPTRSPPA